MNINLLHEFFNSRSDACQLEASQQEQLEKDFQEWHDSLSKTAICEQSLIEKSKAEMKTFEDVTKPVIKYLCENHHSYHTIIITPSSAELSEGSKAYNTTEFIVD